jgi:hypothetical protein
MQENLKYAINKFGVETQRKNSVRRPVYIYIYLKITLFFSIIIYKKFTYICHRSQDSFFSQKNVIVQ